MTARTEVQRTPEGYRLVVSRRVGAPADRAWGLLVDTHRCPEWGPSVTAVACSDRRVREGSTGRVRTVGGLWIPFAVTSCADRRWTWRVGPVPATGHRVEPAGEGCRVAFEVPPLAAPYVVVCSRALANIERLATADAATGCHTG